MPRAASILFAAPHRLAFLTGSINLLALALWWSLEMAATYQWIALSPARTIPPVLLHGPALLLLGYAPFVFGFLLTVFPRWMGYPDLAAPQFGPTAAALALGSLVAEAGIWADRPRLLVAGLAICGIGWGLAMAVLARVLAASRRDAKPVCWHAVSALAALIGGAAALALTATFVATLDPAWWRAGQLVGISCFLLPLFLTVAHRMIPFFAGNVVAGYTRWRPDWLMAVLWGLLLLRTLGWARDMAAMSGVADAGLALTTALMCWKWWPRSAAPGLFKVLIWGFAWAPAGFALSVVAATGYPVGKADVHALLLGFCTTLLVAMVTRVTQGHSGRPLTMPAPAWLAFGAVQLATLARIGAAFLPADGLLLVLAAATFAVGLAPWVWRNAAIYVRPRSDGKAG